MSIIQYDDLIYHSVLLIIECNTKDFDLNELVKKYRVDVKLDETRTILMNNDNIVGKPSNICSTRSKNKHNAIKAHGFVKISYPFNKDSMTYTNPTDLIFEGCYCIYCYVHGPCAHLETCARPRKSSLKLTIKGLIQLLPLQVRDFFKGVGLNIYFKNIKNISKMPDISLNDLGRFKYQDQQNSSTSKDNINSVLKSEIIEFFNELKKFSRTSSSQISSTSTTNSTSNSNSLYKILNLELVIDEALAEINLEYSGKKRINNFNKLCLNSKTKIPLSSVVSMPVKDKRMYFTGPVMLKHRNIDGEGVTIRIRHKKDIKDMCTIELVSNPFSEINLYKEVINRINETNMNVKYSGGTIKSLFTSGILFKDLTKQFDMDKITGYFWPADYNNVRLNHSFVINNLGVTSKEHPDNINYSYIYLSDNNDTWSGKDTQNLYRYKVISHFNVHKNRLCMELIHTSIVSNNLVSGPNKISLQLFSQGHYQLTFSYAKEKDNCINISNFQGIDSQISHIRRTLENIGRNFSKILIELDETHSVIIPKNISSPEYLNLFCTRNGNMPYAKRKKYHKGDIVQIFKNRTMSWSRNTALVKDNISENIYKVLYKDQELNVEYKFLRKVQCTNDQVCRAMQDGKYVNQPKPYSFVCPGIQNGLDKIINPLAPIIGRDNLDYLAPISCTQKHLKWIYNFLINGFTDLEREQTRICRFPINENKYITTEYDYFCGTFYPGTTDIGSEILVKEKELVVIVDKKFSSRDSDSSTVMTDMTDMTDDIDDNSDIDSDQGSESDIIKLYNNQFDEFDELEYIPVEIMDKYKTHGNGNDNIEVVYTVFKKNARDKMYNITGKHFHPKYIENRDFIGLDQTVKKYNDIHNTQQDPITIKDVLLQCMYELDIMGFQKKHKYSNKLSLLNKHHIDNIDTSNALDIDKDLLKKIVIKIPTTMNYLTHSVISFMKDGQLIINDELIDNYSVEMDQDIHFQCLSTNNNFYVLDIIHKELIDDKNNALNNTIYGKNRTLISINKIEKLGLIKLLEKNKINLITNEQKIPNTLINYTKVYIGKHYNDNRYIVPTGIYKNNIVLIVLAQSDDNRVTVGIIHKEKNIQRNIGYLIHLQGVKPGDYVQIKLNVLNNGILYSRDPIVNFKIVTEKEYLGSELTENLLKYIIYAKE